MEAFHQIFVVNLGLLRVPTELLFSSYLVSKSVKKNEDFHKENMKKLPSIFLCHLSQQVKTLTDLDRVHVFDVLSELHRGCEKNCLSWRQILSSLQLIHLMTKVRKV